MGEWLLDLLRTHGYLVVFLNLWGESTPILALFMPGVVVLFAAGYAAGSGEIAPWGVACAAWAGIVVGDTIAYILGRQGLLRSRYIRRFWESSPSLEARLRSHAWWFLLVYHVSGLARSAVPMLAGALRYPFGRWFVLDTIGAGLFAWGMTGLAVLTSRIGIPIDQIAAFIDRSTLVIVVLATVWFAITVVTALRLWRRGSEA